MATKNHPGRFDCYANAEPDEPMFVLLGRDCIAASLVSLWVDTRKNLFHVAHDAEKFNEAEHCAHAMRRWCRDQCSKQPEDVLNFLSTGLLMVALERRGYKAVRKP